MTLKSDLKIKKKKKICQNFRKKKAQKMKILKNKINSSTTRLSTLKN